MLRALFLLLLSAPPLWAVLPPMDELFGPTNLYGISGNGGLTAGFSQQGEVTLLRYPSPSYYDQLFYRTKVGGRHNPRMGAHVYAGLLWGYAGEKTVAFYRDHGGSSRYADVYGSRYVTQYDGAVSEAFVLPDEDVLVLHLSTDREPPVFFENLALCGRKKAELPLWDWAYDEDNDFGLIGPDEDGTVVRFLPYGARRSWEKRLRRSYEEGGRDAVEAMLRDVPGVYVAIAASPYASVFTGAFDPAKDRSEAIERFIKGERNPRDVLLGQLSSLHAFARGTREATVYFAFGSSLPEARGRLEAVRGEPFEALKSRERLYWQNKMAAARLPVFPREAFRNFVLRTLQTIFISMDRDTKAIVASVSTQPPYNLDWPRDGAFLNLLLDWAGFHDLVTEHNLFYLRVQRKEGAYPRPKGTFAMNYYADGVVGGPIPFEIDNTAFVLWTWVEHARYLTGAAKKAYLEKVYPGIRLAANTLVTCKDEENQLPCRANEDDNPEFTQGPHGAVTTYMGLLFAEKAARFLGETLDAGRYAKRRSELAVAIKKQFFNPEKKIYDVGRGLGGWFLYPTFFLPAESAAALLQAEDIHRGVTRALLDPSTQWSMYDAKGVLSLALLWRGERRERLTPLLEELALHVPMEGTLHVGEVYLRQPGEKKWLNIQAPPHVWNAALISLSLYAFYADDGFVRKVTAADFLTPGAR